MKLDWMGEYRDLVGAMIGMCNAYSQVYNVKSFLADFELSPAQLQVMEYILENEELNENMSVIANRLSISQSAFSKIANQLVKRGFLEKYHMVNNRKNVIMRVSDYGKQCYKQYSTGEATDIWRRIFKKLQRVPQEEINIFIDCLNEFSSDMRYSQSTAEQKVSEEELIKIEN